MDIISFVAGYARLGVVSVVQSFCSGCRRWVAFSRSTSLRRKS
jgi:hypothetical protein